MSSRGRSARSSSAPRTLVVSCPDWPVTALAAADGASRPSELRIDATSTVAVLGDDRIVAASRTARAEGVRPGQRSREAQAACPHLVVVRRDLAAEVRAFEQVVAALETFGALVAAGEPGWAAFETRGPARYFGGEVALVDAVDAALARLDLPGTWWGVGLGDGAFIATRASSRQAIVPPGEGAAFLAPLGVEVLGRPELADVLWRLGISTLGAFAALGEAEVLARFGTDGATAHRLAKGFEDSALRVRPRREDFSVAAHLDPPAEGIEAMAFVAKGLAEQLAERLTADGLACTRLRVEAVTTGGEHLARVWSSEGAVRPAVVAERLRWQLEAWLRDGAQGAQSEGARWEAGEVGAWQGVEHVVLVPEEVVPDRGRQSDLWSRPRSGDERAGRAIARVQGMLGASAVVRAVLGGGRGPAERVRLVAFDQLNPGDPGPSRPGGQRQPPWPGRLPPPSPAVVAAVPILAELLDADGMAIAIDARGSMSAAPATFGAGGRALPVVSWAGPWPADERWWDGVARRRRVRLQIITAPGGAYLLALERSEWRIEAVYD